MYNHIYYYPYTECRHLILGTDIGEAVVYSNTTTGGHAASNTSPSQHLYPQTLSFLSKLHCSAASVSSVAWLTDRWLTEVPWLYNHGLPPLFHRLCAIGANDNLIQILQISPPASQQHKSVSSITHYCEIIIIGYNYRVWSGQSPSPC